MLKKPSFSICLFLILIGSIFTAAGGHLFNEHFRVHQAGLVYEGDFVGYKHRRGDKGTTYSPIIKYQYEGKTYKRASQFSSSSRPYSKGQKIRIFIDPQNPKKFLIDSIFQIYLFPGIFLGIGLLVLFLGQYLYKGIKKKRWLWDHGAKMVAKLTAIEASNRSVNKIRGYYFSFIYQHPYRGEIHIDKHIEYPRMSNMPEIGQEIQIAVDLDNPTDLAILSLGSNLVKAA